MNRCFGCNILSPTTTTLALIAALLPVQNLSAARLSVLYSGGSSQKTYARVFVTSTTYDGNLGGLAGADAKCQTRATAAGLSGTWKAILSTSTVSAKDRMAFRKLPVYNLKGHLIWNPSNDTTISGSDSGSMFSYVGAPPFVSNAINIEVIAGSIRYDETVTARSVYVWTGTQGTGTHYLSCSDWTSTATTGTLGYSNTNYRNWTYDTASNACTYLASLYCLEDE